MEAYCNLEVDVNGEETFMVDKVAFLSLLSSYVKTPVLKILSSVSKLCVQTVLDNDSLFHLLCFALLP